MPHVESVRQTVTQANQGHWPEQRAQHPVYAAENGVTRFQGPGFGALGGA
ncbi:MAG: hypothetical protein ACRBC3_08420 [Burkholderiaceae bacterium]